jgi:hypothetical protein
MKKPLSILILFFLFLCSRAQTIQTIVPKQVVAGNAFQIQYVITEPSALTNVSTPEFENLQLISGPNYYKGNSSVDGKMQPIVNITYTLVPLKPGTVKIVGVTADFKNSPTERAEDVTIEVIQQPKASFNAKSTYTDVRLYAPSSKADLNRLIQENLFLTAEVDRKNCYLGEPVVATFKLYSRLQSTSEVINAPSLYGFSVMDMLDLNEAHQTVETINGKVFNTSILRKLQLFPSQSGKLVIDPMQVQNDIEFDDSVKGGKINVQKLLTSQPITISVKPLPRKKPFDYTGAVGVFGITARLQNSEVVLNQPGKLIVAVSGKGNFIQFSEPSVSWPKNIEAFDPLISDQLNKTVVPAEGKREYVFSFTADRLDSLTVPPISFWFFEPDSGKYKKISTDSLHLKIIPAPKVDPVVKKDKPQKQSGTLWWLLLIPVILISLLILFFLFRKKKKTVVVVPQDTKPDYLQRFYEITSLQLSDKQVCLEIQKVLAVVSKECELTTAQKQEATSILNDCQLMAYTDVNAESKKDELIKRTEIFLQKLNG